MDFPLSARLVPRLEVLEAAGSTNDELASRATGADASAWPDLATLVTDTQTSGRGRLGRRWETPPGAALAVSVLLRPAAVVPRGDSSRPAAVPRDRYGWFPLLAGLAATRAVASAFGEPAGRRAGEQEDPAACEAAVTLKWPNDVLIGGKKVCGILSELLPDSSGVVIGAGMNLTQSAAELPVDTATSLRLSGGTYDADAVLAAYLGALSALYDDFVRAAGDPLISGLHAAVSTACGTLGARVRVELPGGDVQTGTATGLDGLGRLVVSRSGGPLTVAAGDVTHLRY